MFITGIADIGETGKLEVDGIEVFDGEGCHLDHEWGHIRKEMFDEWLFVPMSGGSIRDIIGETISFEPEYEEDYEVWKAAKEEREAV